MADNDAFIGYRSAGRRKERNNDRRAAADAPLAALRGFASGVAGAPGDIESLIRMLPGLSERTVLPTSDEVAGMLPLRGVSETPLGRAVTGASQLAGGFYNGPGSPLRALASLPAAVKHGAGEFARAAGVPAVNVIKPKGGNWLSGYVERAVEPLKRDASGRPMAEASMYGYKPEVNPETEAINQWLDRKLSKYIRNEMGTPEDPLRALADRGITHQEQNRLNTYNLDALEDARTRAGFPAEGLAKTQAGREWEAAADYAILPDEAGVYLREPMLKTDPWLAKVPPETQVYGVDSRAVPNMFGHLTDELRNAVNPESGLPAHLLWKYQDLDKVTVPQAVQRVHDINEWRAAQKAEADLARANNAAAHLHKDYPEAGFRWVELKKPTEFPDEEITGKLGEAYRNMSPEGQAAVREDFLRQRGVAALEDALKYEGETMGHCVGGYCNEVAEGRSRIFSLRDSKGRPHVTIETAPSSRINMARLEEGNARGMDFEDALFEAEMRFPELGRWTGEADYNNPELDAFLQKNVPEIYNKYIKPADPLPEIVQIKGKANRAPNDEYLPYVQDFVRSGQWSRVGDLENAGLIALEPQSDIAQRLQRAGREVPKYINDSELTDYLKEFRIGYAEGGAVDAGAFDPLEYNPGKIQSLVDTLREEMNG